MACTEDCAIHLELAAETAADILCDNTDIAFSYTKNACHKCLHIICGLV